MAEFKVIDNCVCGHPKRWHECGSGRCKLCWKSNSVRIDRCPYFSRRRHRQPVREALRRHVQNQQEEKVLDKPHLAFSDLETKVFRRGDLVCFSRLAIERLVGGRFPHVLREVAADPRGTETVSVRLPGSGSGQAYHQDFFENVSEALRQRYDRT